MQNGNRAKKYYVDLTVSLTVEAGDPMEAKAIAKDWLGTVLRHADVRQEFRPRVRHRRQDDEESVLLSEWEEREAVEQRQAREAGGLERRELLHRLSLARTTDEYLEAESVVAQWLAAHEEPYHGALPELHGLLGTFREATVWSEQHPNGPALWNVDNLRMTIKDTIDKELEATIQP